MHISGGYKTLTVTQVCNIISCFEAGKVPLRAVRLYFAAALAVSAREAATRSRAQETKKGSVAPQYKLSELSKLTKLPLAGIRKGLRSLERAGLMRFSDSEIIFTETAIDGSAKLLEELSGGRSRVRPVPIPRVALRFLSRCGRASIAKTMLCYCVRGLSIARRGGEISGKGSVKASWIAKTMGLSLRSVRSARAALIAMGFISGDEGSHQLKLNRTGAYFEINLSWKGSAQKACEMVSQGVEVVESSLTCTSHFSPPPAKNCTNFAPPYKDKKTSSKEEYKNQKTPESQKPAGVFTKQNQEIRKGEVSIRDVKPEDLKSFSCVEELYFQACEKGLVRPSEAQALDFLAAAIRARTAKNGDPARIFAGLIRRKLWGHITQAEEDQARRALMHYRAQNPERFRFSEWRQAA